MAAVLKAAVAVGQLHYTLPLPTMSSEDCPRNRNILSSYIYTQ